MSERPRTKFVFFQVRGHSGAGKSQRSPMSAAGPVRASVGNKRWYSNQGQVGDIGGSGTQLLIPLPGTPRSSYSGDCHRCLCPLLAFESPRPHHSQLNAPLTHRTSCSNVIPAPGDFHGARPPPRGLARSCPGPPSSPSQCDPGDGEGEGLSRGGAPTREGEAAPLVYWCAHPSSLAPGLGLIHPALPAAPTPLQHYFGLVDSGTLRSDDHQTRIIQNLQRLHDDLVHYTPPSIAHSSTSNSLVRLPYLCL